MWLCVICQLFYFGCEYVRSTRWRNSLAFTISFLAKYSDRTGLCNLKQLLCTTFRKSLVNQEISTWHLSFMKYVVKLKMEKVTTKLMPTWEMFTLNRLVGFGKQENLSLICRLVNLANLQRKRKKVPSA